MARTSKTPSLENQSLQRLVYGVVKSSVNIGKLPMQDAYTKLRNASFTEAEAKEIAASVRASIAAQNELLAIFDQKNG